MEISKLNYYKEYLKLLHLLHNTEGKRKLNETKIKYAKLIIAELIDNPQLFNEILYEMEITAEELIGSLSGNTDANIAFYDQLYILIKELKEEKK